MFTGIVEELGAVVELKVSGDAAQLELRGPQVAEDAKHGDSIAVNGVCLTVIDVGADGTFTVDVMGETLSRTALRALETGDPINLERALRANGRFGGHIVQGHVDGVGVVGKRTSHDAWDVVRIGIPTELGKYVAEKGSIAVDGVSLTVSSVGDKWFEVGLIPTTLQLTTLGTRQPGDKVHLEVDVLAKYIERMVSTK